jgi:hypothetical protein
MNSIGISIDVNKKQVVGARTELKKLLDDCKKNYGIDLEVSGGGAGSANNARGGGVSGTTTDKAARSAGIFRRETEATQKATMGILKDYEKLIKITQSRKADPWGPTINSVSQVESDRMRKESERDAKAAWAAAGINPKRKTAAEQYYEQHGNYGRTVTSEDGSGDFGQKGGSTMAGVMTWLKMGGGVVAAFAGISSIAGMLTSAKDKAKEYALAGMPLQLRGITIAPESLELLATKYGVRPGMTQAAVEILSRTSGRRDVTGLLETLGTRSLATSATSSELAGYIGGAFSSVKDLTNTTGSNINRLLSQGLLLGGNTGRYHELYGSFDSLLRSTVQLRGGAPLADKSAESLAALMGLMWNSKDKTLQGASGANLLNQIGTGIAAGGSTPGAQMFLGQALGIEGVDSMSGLWGFQRKMHAGADVGNIRDVINYSRKIAKQRGLVGDEAETFAKMNVRDSLGLSEYQVDSMFGKDFSGSLKNPTGAMGGAINKNKNRISEFLNLDLKNNLGFRSSVASATDEYQQVSVYGDELLKWETALKNWKTGVGNAGRTTRATQYKNMTDEEVSEAARRSGKPGSATAGADYYAIQQEDERRKWGGGTVSSDGTVRLEGTTGLETAILDLTGEIKKGVRWREK